MRIAIEVLGTQSESRFRGVGRYTHELVNALLDLRTDHEFILHAQAGAPSDYIPGAGRAEVRWLEPEPARGERNLSDIYRRLLGTNADRIDLLLLCNPSELRFDYLPPSPPLNGVKMAAVMYDLIPLIFSEHYFSRWPGPEYIRQYVRGLDRLRRYDGFLAISDSTRDDVISRLGVRPDRVVNIGTGGDGAFFKPDSADDRDLGELGIGGPFVFSMGAMEFRKNIWGLIDAFAGLPESVRSSHQLVLTYNPNEDEASRVRSHASSRGVLDRIVLTGTSGRRHVADSLSKVRGVRLSVAVRGVRLPRSRSDALRRTDGRREQFVADRDRRRRWAARRRGQRRGPAGKDGDGSLRRRPRRRLPPPGTDPGRSSPGSGRPNARSPRSRG